MTLPRRVCDVLADHVRLEIECIDRMYLNVFVPELQRTGQVTGFLMRHRGFPIASTALVAPMSRQFVSDIYDFAAAHDVPLIRFAKGQRKDGVMAAHLAGFTGREGIVFIGVAQEKAHVFRTGRRRNPVTGAACPWIVTAAGIVNHYCFCGVDDDFGPCFLKFCSYFPCTARLCINGHEYAKRQAAKAGIGFTALDDGFARASDPAAVQAIGDQLTDDKIDALVRKWLARLPHPFTAAGRAAGYRYELSILQAGFSLTQKLDAPVRGRIFFEQVIRDNLGLGRPDRVSLIFARQIHKGRKRPAPGVFRTRVITQHVTPSLYVDYTHTTIRQYHQEGQALRTKTTVNDTCDFDIGRRLASLPALRQIGFAASRRLLAVQRLSRNPADGAAALAAITGPVTTGTGQRVAGMPRTRQRTQALLPAICVFRLLPRGFTSRDLRHHLAPLPGTTADAMTSGQLSYGLRRLRHHGFIQRIPHTHRCQVTGTGLRDALFLTRACSRLLHGGLAELTQPAPTRPSKLRAAARAYETAIDDLLTRARPAA